MPQPIYRGTHAFAADPWPAPVLTIGNFDGVHRGHRHLLRAAIRLGRPAVALTFHPAPRDVLSPNHGIPRIQTLDDRLDAMLAAGVDAVVVEPFDHEMAALSPEDFAARVLRDRLNPRALALGYDFRFGQKRAGNADTLRAVLGVPVQQIDALTDAAGPVSSSRIRQAVAAGRLEEANALLGRPHVLVGEVERGDQRGRALGFPTANLRPRTALVPPFGVYAVRASVDGVWRPAVANWGVRPMWPTESPQLEVHLLDYAGDLYGQTLRVALVAHLRGEARFDGLEALRAAIDDDIQRARALL